MGRGCEEDGRKRRQLMRFISMTWHLFIVTAHHGEGPCVPFYLCTIRGFHKDYGALTFRGERGRKEVGDEGGGRGSYFHVMIVKGVFVL